VIGHNGTMRLRLENETRTQICVPKQGQDGYIGTSNISYKRLCVVDKIC